MRITKPLAILLALVMVVVCFNVPAISGGGSGDDHPWEQDGIDPDATGSPGDDPDPDDPGIIVDNPDTPTTGGDDPDSPYIDPGTLLDLQFFFQYQIVPDFNTSQALGLGTDGALEE